MIGSTSQPVPADLRLGRPSWTREVKKKKKTEGVLIIIRTSSCDISLQPSSTLMYSITCPRLTADNVRVGKTHLNIRGRRRSGFIFSRKTTSSKYKKTLLIIIIIIINFDIVNTIPENITGRLLNRRKLAAHTHTPRAIIAYIIHGNVIFRQTGNTRLEIKREKGIGEGGGRET